MKAEISFDLVMTDDMGFVEGTFRLPHLDWQVFIFGPFPGVTTDPVITQGKWQSGVTGVHVKWPKSRMLNKTAVLQILSQVLGVTEWEEVRGPDSMQLR